MCRVLVLVVLCISTSALALQPAAPAITGQVLSATGDTPLRRARIDVARGTWRPEPVLSDDQGRFSIDVEGGGPFSVTVTKGGYMTAATTVARADIGMPLSVRLARGAAVTGVVDRNGRLVPRVRVYARRLDANPAADGAPEQYTTDTNDLGEYRLSGLARGRYEISAGTLAGRALNLPGGAVLNLLDPSKRPEDVVKSLVTVEPGDEISGLQLTASDATDVEARLLRDLAKAGNAAGVTPSSDGGIRGRVMTDARMPVPGARVRILGPGVDRMIVADATGAFAVLGVRSGQYTVEAVAVDADMVWRYGQDAAGQAGRPITVGTQGIVEGVDIVLPPSRVVQGIVVDEHGEPIQGARVEALQLQYAGGRLTAVGVGTERRTDDRGSYRLWGLQPGSYVLAASVDGLIGRGRGRQNAYATMYFPGTPILAGATPLDLSADTVANLVFAPIAQAQITGSARDGDAPLVSGQARLVESRRSGAIAATPRSATIQMDGTFVFRNVPPGDYVLQVRGDGPGRTGLFGVQSLSVGNDPINITIRTSYGTTLEGRITFEGAVERAVCTGFRNVEGVSINPGCGDQGVGGFIVGPVALDDRSRAEPTSSLVVSGNDFFITGLFGPTAFALRRATAEGWYVKSLTVNGTDIADTGFDFGARQQTIDGAEIVLSRNGATISGRLGDAVRKTDSYFVVVYPASRATLPPFSRRVKVTRSAADGSFRIAGLPPGDYLITAVNRLQGTNDDGEWQNPEVLNQLDPGTERITLTEGQSRTMTLRLIER